VSSGSLAQTSFATYLAPCLSYLTGDGVIYSHLGALREIVMQQALREPYLMHQILALSARHLSVVRPHSEVFYHNQAIQLQTQALSLFNSIGIGHFDASTSNRVPGFVFAAILGFHSLCDMLSYRDTDFPSALARYVGYLRLHRGVYQINEGHWDEMFETELKPIFDVGRAWFHMSGEGHECDDIRQRIAMAGLDPESLQATLKAINFVQCIFDSKSAPDNCAHVVASWGVIIPNPFVMMIEAGRPEAMVVLAYYFLALHLCRGVWMVGDSGQHLFSLVVNYLGHDWADWLEQPCEMMREFMEEDIPDGEFMFDDQPASSS